jgi:hypothetical protein
MTAMSLQISTQTQVHGEVHEDDNGRSLLGEMRGYFEHKIGLFANHIRMGSLIFVPKLGTISPTSTDIIEEIRLLQPHMVSWSNVIDYLQPAIFHGIARRMSGPDTAHYVHSCNWTSRVFGVDVFDINEKVRLYFYLCGFMMNSVFDAIRNKAFVRKPVNHFREVSSVVLNRKYVNKYFQYFFKGEAVNCACFNGKTPLKIATPLVRNPSTAYVVFAYRGISNINFGLDSYDINEDLD